MIRVFYFASMVLYLLPLVHSSSYDNTSMPICPENFSCPAFGPFNYPYYDATNPGCGLIEVNCTLNNEKIRFGGQSHEIAFKLDAGPSVLIRNRTFENLGRGNCVGLMDNFTSPTPDLFSISITPLVTIFKCPNDPDYAAEIDAYFDKPDYDSYKNCSNYSFYYRIPISNASAPSDLPRRCEVIQLPGMAYQVGNQASNRTDIFSPLISAYSISFPLSPSCDECHNKGGQCRMHQGNFQCLDAKKDSRRKLPRVVLVSVCVGAVTMSIIVISLCLKWLIGWRKMANYNVNVEMFLKNQEFLAPKRYSYSQVEKMTNSFKVKLGQGGFGTVYKGVLSNKNQVAVKVLSEVKGNGEEFINEVASVGRTSHVNIVSLVGFCLEGRRRALIYEFMPNGSLERFIYGRSSSSTSQLGWEKLHEIAIGIARGLEYLHRDCNTRILHFDIKPHNILLDHDFCPKISDFGLAKLFPEKESKIYMSHMRGTPGYIAPELFSRNFGEVSHKSDVYSYGMMILEMVGGRRNIEVGVEHTSEIYFPKWIYKKVELNEQLGLHGIVNEEENRMARKMIIVGLWCIQTNPISRPTITKVLDMLEGDLELLEIPPRPYLCSPSRSDKSPSTHSLHRYSSFTDTL